MMEDAYIKIKNQLRLIKPEFPVFHYTSLKGFLGIIKKKCIHATNILYLNDTREFVFTMKLAGNILKSLKKTKKSKAEIKFLNIMDQALEEPINMVGLIAKIFSTYICSFSAKKDLLSQWRSYCPNGIGLSIGFSYEQLKDFIKKNHGYELRKCLYSHKEQRAIIEALIEEALNNFNNSQSKEPFKKAIIYFIGELFSIAPMLKDPSFEEENEWRLISPLIHYDNLYLEYREGKSMIVPYWKFKLAEKETDKVPISKIIIGPNPHKELSKKAVIGMLNSKKIDCDDRDIINSKIPFRGW